MNIQNKETAIQNEQQSTDLYITQTLLSIESHLKSIAESLYKISKCGLGTYDMTWNQR